MTRLVPLRGGLQALVDDPDWEVVSRLQWCPKYGGRTTYAGAWSPTHKKSVTMHRLLLGFPPKEQGEVDHINGDGLDNRRQNLRVVPHQRNSQNRRAKLDCLSGLKGVYFEDIRGESVNPRRRPWKVMIETGGVRENLGMFETKEEAGRAYDLAAIRLFGPYAKLNFPGWTGPDPIRPNSYQEAHARLFCGCTHYKKRHKRVWKGHSSTKTGRCLVPGCACEAYREVPR